MTEVVGCTAGARGVESPVVLSTGAFTIGCGIIGAGATTGAGVTGAIGACTHRTCCTACAVVSFGSAFLNASACCSSVLVAIVIVF